MKYPFLLLLLILSTSGFTQSKSDSDGDIPAIYSKITRNSKGLLEFTNSQGNKMTQYIAEPKYTLSQIQDNLSACDKGLQVDMGENFEGKLYFGLITPDAQIKQPVFFKRTSTFVKGKAIADVTLMKGIYDITGWEISGKVNLGYRIADNKGNIIYDGKITLRGTGPFTIDTSIIEGPLVNCVTDNSVIISYTTNYPIETRVFVGDRERRNSIKTKYHEILITQLDAETQYPYRVYTDQDFETSSFTTAPLPGSRKPFVFAYASDCRNGEGGGERNIFGTNAFMFKKMAALAKYEKMAFFQLTGDMITGYSQYTDETRLQYINWKRVIEPFGGQVPFYSTVGNHEGTHLYFKDTANNLLGIPAFPFRTMGSEDVYSDLFVNFRNGPLSEDGSKYDPNPQKHDFPEYGETVYYYTYDNTAMIVLNSNYWYAQVLDQENASSGNLHGYIMDNQMIWLEKTLTRLQEDKNIDHIFVTLHTPAFPNAGHVSDDMWYNGNNQFRPYIAGKPVDKGIIERRDEFLNLLLKNSKVIGYLAGDEHNYTRMLLTDQTPIYPDNWTKPKINIYRPLWCITNGAAGAPYYVFEKTPWSASVERFTTQYTLLLFYVDGKNIKLRAINPDTLEEIENVTLK